ncbi:response regulator transcription factor [Sphingomonas psychrotolerans]|uniref:DNA-binding response regulator n=1 Tax=Sphingomonas psychrotolerans TaxID=1327635 RepID=A0A2K8MPK9_9SPHN|nr:response regulator transcription factor [Sphingomonas psychrotolerans]ATY33361.1 DNA-binding response regulator [Sphingomonas psychrotolerans]
MRIAVVDDDESVIEFASAALAAADHSCISFRTGAALLAALRRQTFDLILLDWNLPDSSGMELLRSIRDAVSRATAIIMLTSRSDKDDVAAALHAGADDYVVKPETATVIVARVQAVLRRAMPTAVQDRVLQFGSYGFDRLTERVSVGDEEVALSAKEFQLALTLFENMHRALSRSYLLETIWQSAADLSTRTLDMHVSRIRSKLKLTPENGYRIVAISGYGYRMERFGAES